MRRLQPPTRERTRAETSARTAEHHDVERDHRLTTQSIEDQRRISRVDRGGFASEGTGVRGHPIAQRLCPHPPLAPREGRRRHLLIRGRVVVRTLFAGKIECTIATTVVDLVEVPQRNEAWPPGLVSGLAFGESHAAIEQERPRVLGGKDAGVVDIARNCRFGSVVASWS